MFNIEFAIAQIREIARLEKIKNKTPEQIKEQLWHKRMLGTQINMQMGEIGETLTPDQEKIVNAFIAQISRSYPEQVFRKHNSKPQKIISEVSLDPEAMAIEIAMVISSPERISEWLANNEAIQAVCRAMAKTETGQQMLHNADQEWKLFNLEPPFNLDKIMEEWAKKCELSK